MIVSHTSLIKIINRSNISRQRNCATVVTTLGHVQYAHANATYLHATSIIVPARLIASRQNNFFFLYIPLPVCATMTSNKRCTCDSYDKSVTIRHCETMLCTKVLVPSIMTSKFATVEQRISSRH